MFCSSCGAAIPEGAANCPQCGAPVGQQQTPEAPQNVNYAQPPGNRANQFDFGSFLSFDIMITPMVMRIIYIVGSGLIALTALIVMFTMGIVGFFGGLIGGSIALIVYRITCETSILFFKMHQDIRSVNENTKRQ